jgi:FAD/FMN-containing dehydrogenase/Fe-S oxidoreductase
MVDKKGLFALSKQLEGEILTGNLYRALYATDASVYKQWPIGVAFPKTKKDIIALVDFAQQTGLNLIPRAGGTSLAGQCVGEGLVVDVSRYLNRILEINVAEKWVRVEPGVIRDELNKALAEKGLYFGPNTSTANRCTIGGMVGNNSCGTTSIVYGSTRDHVIALEVVLADGSLVIFEDISLKEIDEKIQQKDLEGLIYAQIYRRLRDQKTREEIKSHYPKKGIERRNTGYAVDILMEQQPFNENGSPFNLAKLLCGSEGTLAFTTEIKLSVSSLPPSEQVVVAVHFENIINAMHGVGVAMAFQPDACELMDKIILDCTKGNISQRKNRFFIEGDPGAVLMIAFRGDTLEEAKGKASQMINAFQSGNLAYAYPIIEGKDTEKVWALRAAGLGVLSNVPGDAKPVACIEDTAVLIEDLPEYIQEFSDMMKQFNQEAVYYAHAGAGEIHLRPILNLKSPRDRKLFYDISEASAKLVKKYGGSLSGEHGDGRVRASFIPLMIGDLNYQLLKEIKETWDSNGIFNLGKIVNAQPMLEDLRYEENQQALKVSTKFNFDWSNGILGAAELCNGSGDCRKLNFSGGLMCPSYRATRNEKDSTRGRANVLREFLTMNVQQNPFNHPEIKEVMDLCLSCKACTAECPSNVDMTTLKAEFLYQYQKSNGISLRTQLFAHIASLNAVLQRFHQLSNFLLRNKIFSSIMKSLMGIAKERSFPLLAQKSWKSYIKKYRFYFPAHAQRKGSLYLFCDEFSNLNESDIGIKAVKLLNSLGFDVKFVAHPESGRAAISKGLLDYAHKIAEKQIKIFSALINEECPLVGIEPSAILSFKDEYPRLVSRENKKTAEKLAKHVFTLESFLMKALNEGLIGEGDFTDEEKSILVHVHCHQTSLSSAEEVYHLLSLPKNYSVQKAPAGCCGMAGSFGYEKEHFDLSMEIGNQGLLPAVRNSDEATIILATGTSCRHQILDATSRRAYHTVEILYDALASPTN